MKITKHLLNLCFSFCLCFLITGCLSHASTTYELDKRGTTTPPTEGNAVDDNLTTFSTSAQIPRATHMPERLPPLIEKVWITPQILADGTKIEGTWMWVTVDQGRWVSDEDAGSAPLDFDENQANALHLND